jgi:hypothetical protein
VREQNNIGDLTGGIVVVGGTGTTVNGPGTVNVTAGSGDDLAELRRGLADLVQILSAGPGGPALHGLLGPAREARDAAGQDAPEPGRIRRQLDAVIRGARNVTLMTTAAASTVTAATGVAELAERLARLLG